MSDKNEKLYQIISENEYDQKRGDIFYDGRGSYEPVVYLRPLDPKQVIAEFRTAVDQVVEEQIHLRRVQPTDSGDAVRAGRAFRKKPVVIEAIQFTEEVAWDSFLNRTLIFDKFSVSGNYYPSDRIIRSAWVSIPTLEGTMRAEFGDWIIKGVKGEFYPCKPDIFAATYEAVIPNDNYHAQESQENKKP